MAARPKAMLYKDGKRKVVSIRRFIDLDYIREDNYTLIQWGKDPVKFICFTKKDKKFPLFLLSLRWSTTIKIRGIYMGHTLKPIDTGTFWRKQCNRIVDLDRYRQQTTLTRRISSKAGSIPTTVE